METYQVIRYLIGEWGFQESKLSLGRQIKPNIMWWRITIPVLENREICIEPDINWYILPSKSEITIYINIVGSKANLMITRETIDLKDPNSLEELCHSLQRWSDDLKDDLKDDLMIK